MDWSTPRRCLLLGAAGTGMQSLATILAGAGHQVYGADTAIGSAVTTKQHAANSSGQTPASTGSMQVNSVQLLPWDTSTLPERLDVCVCSAAVPEDAGLRQLVMQQQIPLLPLHAAVSSLFKERLQIAVAGTHGKSTTAALLAWLLSDQDSNAGRFVGARYQAVSECSGLDAVSGGHFGNSRLAVIEACEFGDSYLQLQPAHAILTGIDGDHFDWFKTSAAEVDSYVNFLESVSSAGCVVVNATCPESCIAVAAAGANMIRCSLDGNSDADWTARVLWQGPDGTQVQIAAGGVRFGEACLPLHGLHNVENLLLAVAMASQLGTSAETCLTQVARFPGLQRRLELRSQCGGMVLLDDYAHHPAAVKTTLSAVQTRYSGRNIRVLFEPHQVIRLRRLWPQFLQALALADEVVVLPVFPARERASMAECCELSRRLTQEIRAAGTSAIYVDGVHSAASFIELTGQPEDVFLTMGAGHVHHIHDQVHRRFQRHTAA